jgi:hypothetical protein
MRGKTTMRSRRCLPSATTRTRRDVLTERRRVNDGERVAAGIERPIFLNGPCTVPRHRAHKTAVTNSPSGRLAKWDPNAWSTPSSPPLWSPSPSAPFDWMGSPWQRGAQGLSGGSTHAVSSGGGKKRVGGLGAGYPAKALGVARSDLEHCADLQATLRPEKSTSGVLSLSLGRYSMPR